VVERTGGVDKEKWIDAFIKADRPNSIEGAKKMRPCDNQAEQDAFWAKGTRVGADYAMTVTKIVPSAQIFSACK
jgi:hypothetical protein